MSRFSRAEAEAAGWAIAHEQDERTEIVGGRLNIIPGLYRAEKRLPNGSLVNLAGETEGKLLESIAGTEAHWGNLEDTSLPEPGREPVEVQAVKLDHREDEDAEGTNSIVAVADETQTIATGEHIEATDAENERTANPDVGAERLDIDETQSAIDGPGRQGTFLVREGETLDDVAARKASESQEAEETKSTVAPVPADERLVETPDQEFGLAGEHAGEEATPEEPSEEVLEANQLDGGEPV